MAIVCVLIGEGKSEKAFFSSLLLNQLGFCEVQEKNCIVYQSTKNPELFWVFPIPSYGETHKGGFKMLQDGNTYLECKYIVKNLSWVWGNNPQIYYRIIVDTDNHGEAVVKTRISKIESAITSVNLEHKDHKIYLVNTEIESWFLSGLTLAFPFIGNNGQAKKLIEKDDIESISDPKKVLDDLLDIRITGDRQRIGRDFGEYLNISQALAKSESFATALTGLTNDGLLSIPGSSVTSH